MAEDTNFHPKKLSEDVHHVIAVIYALLALLAFILNSLVIFTFYKDRSLLVPSNLLILSISVADWLMAVVANPFGVAANASEAWSLSGTSCVFYAFVTTTLAFGVIMHHTAIAMEKYLVLTHPYMEVISNRRMLMVMVVLWAFSLLWSVFPLFGWSAYVPEAGNTACSIRWQSSDKTDQSYIYAIFSLFYFAPILIIVSAYGLMYRSVKWMSENALEVWGSNSEPTLAILNAKVKTAKMSCIMVVGFLVGWTPYAVVSLCATRENAETLSPVIGVIPGMIAKTTTSYNPIIYCFMYDRFKASLKRSLVCSGDQLPPSDV